MSQSKGSPRPPFVADRAKGAQRPRRSLLLQFRSMPRSTLHHSQFTVHGGNEGGPVTVVRIVSTRRLDKCNFNQRDSFN
jgi:hypothetical protein